ncbi:MAG: hypothetical protein LBI82_01965 [Dysgonamonadaceae bacterium]|jgi:hypothetical protein|nr:hypothetical protein [Dysgonamonadaceae bacterium]
MKKIILIIVGIVVFFTAVFIFGNKTSPIGEAVNAIKRCRNKDEVHTVWDTNSDLQTNNFFEKEIRNKLSKLNLSSEDVSECLKWLPPAPTSLNLIVVPDLSRRIIDEVNNPDQINNDTVILNHIWKAFEKHSIIDRTTKMRKINSKDRLIIDVTDEGQAVGQFRTLANDLIFDLSFVPSGQNNEKYLKDCYLLYFESIKKMYELAEQKPIGADYWNYFKRNLPKHIQKSTLFDTYRNVLIIITDGYLETENQFYTGSWTKRKEVERKIKEGKSIKEALSGFKIPNIAEDFSTLEVLILEVKERKPNSKIEKNDKGTSEDFYILMTLWKDWFGEMGVKNVNDKFFIQRNDATQLTKKEIDKLLSK